MTNDKAKMTNEIQSSNDKKAFEFFNLGLIWHLVFVL
jgi:hypothetical protein